MKLCYLRGVHETGWLTFSKLRNVSGTERRALVRELPEHVGGGWAEGCT